MSTSEYESQEEMNFFLSFRVYRRDGLYRNMSVSDRAMDEKTYSEEAGSRMLYMSNMSCSSDGYVGG